MTHISNVYAIILCRYYYANNLHKHYAYYTVLTQINYAYFAQINYAIIMHITWTLRNKSHIFYANKLRNTDAYYVDITQ